MREPWFAVKQYGIGLSPKGRSGWTALGVYVAAVVGTAPVARHFAAPHWAPRLAIAGLTVGFLGLVFVKSDRRPWRWRWGGR